MEDKKMLRRKFFVKGEKVLDCFAGECNMRKDQINSGEVEYLGIDKVDYGQKNILIGDNMKFLKGIDLSRYDIVDLDAYGVPFKQLHILYEKGYKGKVFVTFIQIMYGALPKQLLYMLGYTKEMLSQCPSLFHKDGLEKIKYFLYTIGVRKIHIISKGKKKHYMYFVM